MNSRDTREQCVTASCAVNSAVMGDINGNDDGMGKKTTRERIDTNNELSC